MKNQELFDAMVAIRNKKMGKAKDASDVKHSPKAVAVSDAIADGGFGCREVAIRNLCEAILGEVLPSRERAMGKRPRFIRGSLVVLTGNENEHNYPLSTPIYIVRIDDDGDAEDVLYFKKGVLRGYENYPDRENWRFATDAETESFCDMFPAGTIDLSDYIDTDEDDEDDL